MTTVLNTVDTNRIKLEAKTHALPVPPSGSRFGRFIRSVGALAAPIGYASSLFFPPGALIGAGAHGMYYIGGYQDAARRREGNTAGAPAIFPSINTQAGGPTASISAPGGAPMAADPLNLISSRQATFSQMTQEVGR